MRYTILLILFFSHIRAQDYLMIANQTSEERSGYYFSFNESTKICNWISYTLTSDDVKGSEIPLRVFHKDSATFSCSNPSDYNRQGYARGMLKPRSAARASVNEMKEVHNMLNVVPMNMTFSKGAWRILNNMIAGWAVVFDSVFVVTGPIFENEDPQMIGESKITVPDKFFKVVLVRNGLDLGAIGFILPNKNPDDNLQQYAMPVDSVEKITGYDFFSELPEYLEAFTEETFKPSLWKDQSVSFKLKSSFLKKGQCVAAEKSDERCTSETSCITQNCWSHGCDIKTK